VLHQPNLVLKALIEVPVEDGFPAGSAMLQGADSWVAVHTTAAVSGVR
jgi:hypothetical protein